MENQTRWIAGPTGIDRPTGNCESGRSPSRGDTLRLGLIWLGSYVLAVFVSGADAQTAVLPPAIAAAVAACGWRWAPSRRLAAVGALAASVLQPATVLPWTIAAIGFSLAVLGRDRVVAAGSSMDELDRYLARCRRRDEAATALFVGVRADATTVRALLASARVTDSLVVRQTRSRTEVYGLLDGADVVREAVEARFASQMRGLQPTFGWAAFPADGLTLDLLIEQARRSASPARDNEAAEPTMLKPALAFQHTAAGS